MPTNPHFLHWDYKPEQDLISDLVSEAIQIQGMDVYYIPRTEVDLDTVLGEDPSQSFTKHYPVEAYLEKEEGLQILPFVTKLGLKLPKTVRLVMSKTRFAALTPLARPREGDVIYIPLDNTIFEIAGVTDKEHLYPAGVLPSWHLDLETFDFSHEEMDTGVDEVDQVDENHNDSENLEGILNEDNTQIEIDGINAIDRTESSPFGVV